MAVAVPVTMQMVLVDGIYSGDQDNVHNIKQHRSDVHSIDKRESG